MRRSTGTVKRGQWDKAEVWRAFVWRTIGVLLLFTALLKAWQPSSLEPAMSFIGLADTAKVAAIGAIVAAEVTIGYGLLVFGGTCLAGMAAVLLGVFSVALFGFVLSKEPPACGCLGVVRVFESNRAEALFGLGRNLVFMGALVWTLGATVKEQPQ